MRTRYTLINSIAGLLYKILQLTSAFIVRYFLTRYFIEDYIGLEGLFSNIVGFFSIADLGLGAAISFSLYEPIHRKEYAKVNSIMKLYKKVYCVLGIIIIILAIAILPFIPYLIKGSSLDYRYIQFSFFIYSFGTAITYFFSYNRTLIFALQKNYLVLIVDSLTKLFCSILQIVAIVVLKSYIFYLMFIGITNFASNIIISIICNKIRLHDDQEIQKLPDTYIKKLKKDVKALAITNVFGKLITATDNILISSLVGVIDLAKNSNYSLIITGVQSLVVVCLEGAKASIGDLIAEKDLKKINFYFERYCFAYYGCAMFVASGVFFISEPFISMWVGNEFLFNIPTLLCTTINLYLMLIMQPIATFQNFGGLYAIYQPIIVKAALINLFLSIILGLKYKLIGIFIGTLVSYLYQIYGFGLLLHRYLLHKSSKLFFISQLKYLVVFLGNLLILYIIGNRLDVGSIFLNFVLRCFILLFIFFVIFNCFYGENENMKYFKNLIKRRVLKK